MPDGDADRCGVSLVDAVAADEPFRLGHDLLEVCSPRSVTADSATLSSSPAAKSPSTGTGWSAALRVEPWISASGRSFSNVMSLAWSRRGVVAAVRVAPGGRLRCLVEHEAEHRGRHPAESLERVGHVVAGHPAGLCHHDHAVDGTGERHRVGHRQHGCRVDDDHVVVVAHLGEQLGGASPAEQFARVRGHRARRVDAEPVGAVDVDVAHGVPGLGAEQQVGEARRLGNAEHLVEARAAEVGVDERHAVAGLGEHHREVRRCRGLALPRHRTGQLDHVDRPVEPQELHVGAQSSVRLDRFVARSADRDGQVVGRRIDGHDGEHRLAGRDLEVVFRSDLVVEVVEQEGCPEPDQQADDGGEDGRAGRSGLDRRGRAPRPT